METKIEKGNQFIPHKPEYNKIGSCPIWITQMDTLEGKVLIAEDVFNDGVVLSNEWHFHPDWCEKVESAEPTKAEEDFPIYNHIKTFSPQTISTEIDWEQRRYELAKEFMAASITGLVTARISWVAAQEVDEAIKSANEMIKQLKVE